MISKVDTDTGAGGFYRIMGTEASLSVPDLTKWSHKGEKGWTEILKEGNDRHRSKKVSI
jgi:hypothetical protein